MNPPGISDEGVRHELLAGNVPAWLGMYATYVWAAAEIVYGVDEDDRIDVDTRVFHCHNAIIHLCRRFGITDEDFGKLGADVHGRPDLFGHPPEG